MIPSGTILSCVPLVDERVSRGNWTLSNAIHAVHMHCLVLPDSVPVDTGTIIGQTIDDSDLDYVSPTGLQPRSRICIIEQLSFVEG